MVLGLRARHIKLVVQQDTNGGEKLQDLRYITLKNTLTCDECLSEAQLGSNFCPICGGVLDEETDREKDFARYSRSSAQSYAPLRFGEVYRLLGYADEANFRIEAAFGKKQRFWAFLSRHILIALFVLPQFIWMWPFYLMWRASAKSQPKKWGNADRQAFLNGDFVYDADGDRIQWV